MHSHRDVIRQYDWVNRRHPYVGGTGPFACPEVCGEPPEHPVHLSFEEQDLMAMAEIERREAARVDADPEC
jgi:hypothetical protein